MNFKTRRVTTSSGVTFETPLLVPSLSSRAHGAIHSTEGGRLASVPCSLVHSKHLLGGIEESLLVSAFDIKYGFLADSDAFRADFARSRYAQPRVFMIDSGWYEKSASITGSIHLDDQVKAGRWRYADYLEVVDGLDPNIQAIVVSSDHKGSYGEQISRAQSFFGARPALGSTFLLKPEGRTRFHDLRKLSDVDVANLRSFTIVGLAEKDLGDNLLERMLAVARLRERMDQQGVEIPIHLFGGLDPLYTPLYFAAGAEIFDGVGWLRYSYRDGVAMNRESSIILDDGQSGKSFLFALLSASLRNLDVMRTLTEDLRLFAASNGNWSKFRTHGESLRRVYEQFAERSGRS